MPFCSRSLPGIGARSCLDAVNKSFKMTAWCHSGQRPPGARLTPGVTRPRMLEAAEIVIEGCDQRMVRTEAPPDDDDASPIDAHAISEAPLPRANRERRSPHRKLSQPHSGALRARAKCEGIRAGPGFSHNLATKQGLVVVQAFAGFADARKQRDEGGGESEDDGAQLTHGHVLL